MPTEVKPTAMRISIAELAEKHRVLPAHVERALADLEVDYSGADFEIDDETRELLEGELADHEGSTVVPLPRGRTPRDIALSLGIKPNDILKTLMTKVKVMATLTTTLEDEVAEKLVGQFGYEIDWVADRPKPKSKPQVAAGKKSEPIKRPPVVTILGHVDHGKTSLLDYIRKANVADKEHGGITQHIGAYQVELPEGVITFLDTPGHAAFTAMRARGAAVTDVAILVVAADDGIMPQTIEAISHAKSAEVPIIVAVNKIDKPDANPDRVITQLPEHNLIPESFGGDVIVAPVSAMTGEGVPGLLEMILLQADVMELKADPKAELQAVVVEAKLEKGRGPVATLLIQEGTLETGEIIVVGSTWGKIRAMTDYKGEKLKSAGPSTPVEVIGLNEVPEAGDQIERVKNEKAARDIVQARVTTARDRALNTGKRSISLRDLRAHMEAGETKELNLIVKGDVQGSVEAVRGLLDKIENDEVKVRVIHSGVGAVTESDILLASASSAICVGFNVKPEGKAKAEAERQKVEIRTYTIIYELIEDIEAAVKGMLEPKFEEEYRATIEIRAVFNLTRIGKVAGCHITDGKVQRSSKARVKRDGEVVYDGEIASLRNVKQDVREMIAGQDCGIRFEGWDEFQEGDVIEAFELVQVG